MGRLWSPTNRLHDYKSCFQGLFMIIFSNFYLHTHTLTVLHFLFAELHFPAQYGQHQIRKLVLSQCRETTLLFVFPILSEVIL